MSAKLARLDVIGQLSHRLHNASEGCSDGCEVGNAAAWNTQHVPKALILQRHVLETGLWGNSHCCEEGSISQTDRRARLVSCHRGWLSRSAAASLRRCMSLPCSAPRCTPSSSRVPGPGASNDQAPSHDSAAQRCFGIESLWAVAALSPRGNSGCQTARAGWRTGTCA